MYLLYTSQPAQPDNLNRELAQTGLQLENHNSRLVGLGHAFREVG